MKGNIDMKNNKKWIIILCAILVALMVIGPVASVVAMLFA